MSEHRFSRGQLGAPGPLITRLFTGVRHRVLVSWYKLAALIEFEDALFRTGSAVMMPEGEAPANSDGTVRTSVGVLAACLRHQQEYPALKVLIAGHTDTAGAASYNQTLSEKRAHCVTALLMGDRAGFVAIGNDPAWRKVSDYKQILKWVHERRAWDCDPGAVNEVHDNATYHAILGFQRAYNSEGPGASRAAPVAEDGMLGKQTWGAFFDVYEDRIAEELGTDVPGLASFRAGMSFLTPDMLVGCGEAHPREAENVDEYRSQTNRRVEVLFFDPGEEPELPCHAGGFHPEQCVLYDRDFFRRRILPSMPSALPWTAEWDAPEAHMDEPRAMTLVAPGLGPGESMLFEVTQVGFGKVGEVTVASGAGVASADFDDWYQPESIAYQGTLSAGQAFAPVQFTFVVTGAGRRVESPSPVTYNDRVHLVLTTDDGTPLANQPYVVASPWGAREGTTSADAVLDEQGLPPGGASVLLRNRALVDLGELRPGWDDGAL